MRLRKSANSDGSIGTRLASAGWRYRRLRTLCQVGEAWKSTWASLSETLILSILTAAPEPVNPAMPDSDLSAEEAEKLRLQVGRRRRIDPVSEYARSSDHRIERLQSGIGTLDQTGVKRLVGTHRTGEVPRVHEGVARDDSPEELPGRHGSERAIDHG